MTVELKLERIGATTLLLGLCAAALPGCASKREPVRVVEGTTTSYNLGVIGRSMSAAADEGPGSLAEWQARMNRELSAGRRAEPARAALARADVTAAPATGSAAGSGASSASPAEVAGPVQVAAVGRRRDGAPAQAVNLQRVSYEEGRPTSQPTAAPARAVAALSRGWNAWLVALATAGLSAAGFYALTRRSRRLVPDLSAVPTDDGAAVRQAMQPAPTPVRAARGVPPPSVTILKTA